jgi:hypothetical protein
VVCTYLVAPVVVVVVVVAVVVVVVVVAVVVVAVAVWSFFFLPDPTPPTMRHGPFAAPDGRFPTISSGRAGALGLLDTLPPKAPLTPIALAQRIARRSEAGEVGPSSPYDASSLHPTPSTCNVCCPFNSLSAPKPSTSVCLPHCMLSSPLSPSSVCLRLFVRSPFSSLASRHHSISRTRCHHHLLASDAWRDAPSSATIVYRRWVPCMCMAAPRS